MSAAEVARALGGAARAGRSFVARCPAHEDRTPSLSIRDGDDGRLLWYCHGGCSQDRVRDALRDLGLWDARNPRSAPRPSRTPSPPSRTPSPPDQRRDDTADRRAKALHLWRQRRPITGSVAEIYLRETRGITCLLPATLGFLPGNDRYPAALIAAFGMAVETAPGVIVIHEHAVMAVHLTKLTTDGRKHPDEPNKIMLGRALGSPIVLAPMNDLLGLAITEGIEDALTAHQALGLGAWAAASAGMMPALADTMPEYCDCVSIFADANEAGERNSALLQERLTQRGIYAEIVPS